MSDFLQVKYSKQTGRKTVILSSGKQSSSESSRLPYIKELEKVKSKLRCSDHQLGEDTFCWVDVSKPNAPHYPLCAQDLQEWAIYLVCAHLQQGYEITLTDGSSKSEIRTTPASFFPPRPISMKFEEHVRSGLRLCFRGCPPK